MFNSVHWFPALLRGTRKHAEQYGGCDLVHQRQIVKMALTTDLRALVEAVLAVVLPVTQPLLGDALVLGAGELVPQARRVCGEGVSMP